MSSRRSAGWRKSIVPASAAVIAAGVLAGPVAANAATVGNVWSVVKSPNVTTGQFATNLLIGVSAVSDTDVWAAGYENQTGADPAGNHPLIEHWNGTAWSVALNGAENADLTGISADSATDAWAVGNVESDRTVLAEHWNGTAWSKVALPTPTGTTWARMEGVTALSPSNAWAVGWISTNSLNLPLIEHWDGTSWSVVPNVPRQVSDSNFLHGITAVSATDIWAVGEVHEGSEGALMLHYDGTAWSLVRPAQLNPGENDAFPVAAAAVSSTDVWAVGGEGFTNQDQVTTQQPYAAHWDGTQWSEVATPVPPVPSAAFAFTSVAALSSTDVWAVGITGGHAFIDHWDGTAWSQAGTPTLGTGGSTLFGVTRSGPNRLWAVGDNSPKSLLTSHSLTLHTTRG